MTTSEASIQDGIKVYRCEDCALLFDEFEAMNASLVPDENNPCCPGCGSDWAVPQRREQ